MILGLSVLVVFTGFGIGLWLVSYVVEALRPVPQAPQTLRWAPDIPIVYVDVCGHKLRYIKAGRGPNLVLLHTLRTQLDLFQKVVPDLAKCFTVYALDYPGHGYSDIPRGRYDADYFAASVEGFLDALDLHDVMLGGVSIGGAIALILAARHNPRVARVVAINPYDYDRGRGIARSSSVGWITMVTSDIPVVGATFMRLRTFMLIKTVFQGGLVNPTSIPPALLKEMYEVGNRRGHYRAFISLLRNAASWEAATEIYGQISVPVRLIWGDKDWARPSEREHDRRLLPSAEMLTVAHGGHFLPLDRPDALIDLIKGSPPSISVYASSS
jgi:pimeloyl-ACP methyl ester carboxylesterase